jgi:hypothetical protein
MLIFIDQGRWLEPERNDGKPRQYEPAATVIIRSKNTLRRLEEVLQADHACTSPRGHTSDKQCI